MTSYDSDHVLTTLLSVLVFLRSALQYFRELGCTTDAGKKRKAAGDDTSADSGAKATLKLPLAFPKQTKKRAGGK